ncbi:GntR family transcriptional regulator [Dongia soli]|uniref:GntR family transcriptional regulator n=1 Tax=Dongia soli TaxID=600628 RepID=A0ABU5EH82_9PROT|nr:GntR family transcriptional regulator [Dongia soli]MDY0885247.1 GntR family transcriptional regulator [Dongia soli]
MSVQDDMAERPLSMSRERFERIYKTIRDRICLLEYGPGARLAEEELAEEFHVSRTPIRRVLTRLESEGLLESRHGVGTFVTDVDIDALAQVFQLRMELAVLIGKLDPVPRTEDDLGRLRALVERCDQLAKKPEPKTFMQLNIDFFQELGSMIGNVPLRDISERLYYLTTRIWIKSVPHLNLPDEIAVFRREMADILAAMEVGDLEAVGHIRRSHISMSVKRMKRYPER